MAKRKTASKKRSSTSSKRPFLRLTRQQKVLLGTSFMLLAIALAISFVSHFFTGINDQSDIGDLSRNAEVENWLRIFGATLSDFFIEKGFGIASFFLVGLLFLTGFYLFFGLRDKKKLLSRWFWGLLLMVWLSIALGLFIGSSPSLGGTIGFELNDFLINYIGSPGVIMLLVFILAAYLILRLKLTPETAMIFFKRKKEEVVKDLQPTEERESKEKIAQFDDSWITSRSEFELVVEDPQPTIQNNSSIETDQGPKGHKKDEEVEEREEKVEKDLEMTVEKIVEEKEVKDNLAYRLVKDFGEFDPTLELSNYRFPTIELLKEYGESGITINEEELEENKNRIVSTLKNYKIEIARIKATIGPTVTLYEIVPEAGIRISKIKSLEDDIALSLAALGIRIIAPMPGKGTIGIEVPNKRPTIVSMRSMITSPKFQNAEMTLPMALGKTISNETFVVDLTKMPHLLMAGATGQGKSVGLNVILTSLLYKKHPAEIKLILVDPKKVELTLFNKIERHFLAKLPDEEEAIITDTTKVVRTLNSLCMEMDERYELLKDAMCRNIREYNNKFKARKLNPNDGHRFLPYIVLVVDEFADLIMTAGKEVETPISRLAQLARAIGIHLVIATQRPSVNVITGLIKANFPARIAFRVTSKIDSRTILDGQGADQLIGRGDMLFTQGSDIIRLQCAFVDTPEIAKITEFIGSQRAYPKAHLLPDYSGDDAVMALSMEDEERDPLFREAAEVIVASQQGSASLLQRKLKLGYNRAGRLIDQLEAAGVVGPFEGSKAREVLISDILALEDLFNKQQNND